MHSSNVLNVSDFARDPAPKRTIVKERIGIKIEKNVPLEPNIKRGMTASLTDEIADMEIGDSFELPCSMGGSTQTIVRKVFQGRGWDCAIRLLRPAEPGSRGLMRVWRVA